jgi:hypothetical protein
VGHFKGEERSNLGLSETRGRIVPPPLYHHLGLEWNTISRAPQPAGLSAVPAARSPGRLSSSEITAVSSFHSYERSRLIGRAEVEND